MKYLIALAALVLVGCDKAELTTKEVAGCTVLDNGEQTFINCADGTNAVIDDGLNGVAGTDGVASIIDIVDPCGNETIHDEVLLVFNNNQVVAWFVKVGLVVLEPGRTYITTDGTRCKFTVTVDGTVNVRSRQ